VLDSVVIDLATGKTKGIKGGLTRITEGLSAADGVEVDFKGWLRLLGFVMVQQLGRDISSPVYLRVIAAYQVMLLHY